MNIEPPPSFPSDCTLVAGVIYRCDSTKKTNVFLLWANEKQSYIESTHGFTEENASVEDIVKLCRKMSIGTYIPYVRSFWELFVNSNKHLRLIWRKTDEKFIKS